jgi:hypothetical protein
MSKTMACFYNRKRSDDILVLFEPQYPYGGQYHQRLDGHHPHRQMRG